MRDAVDAKICGRYLKHRLLRVENLNDILNCRPSAEKLTRSLDLLAVSGYKALVAILKDHMSENYKTIMAKFYRSSCMSDSHHLSLCRIYFLSHQARCYELNLESDFITFAATVSCLIIEVNLL